MAEISQHVRYAILCHRKPFCTSTSKPTSITISWVFYCLGFDNFIIEKTMKPLLLKTKITKWFDFTILDYLFVSLHVLQMMWFVFIQFLNHERKFTFRTLMVFFCQTCPDLLWEKIVLVIEKNFWNSRLKAKKFQIFWDH